MENDIMDWIKAILDKHKKEDGTVDLLEANKEIDAEFPKNAVPKADFNSKVNELKSANDTLDTLKKDNKDVEALQNKIKEHETTVTQLQTDLAAERKNFAIKERLTKEGVTDVDYIKYKLGDVEMDKDGNLVGLDNKLKDLKASNPTFFGAKDESNPNVPGYKVIDNKLDNGKAGTLSKDDIMKIKDDKERQEKIKENINLFQ